MHLEVGRVVAEVGYLLERRGQDTGRRGEQTGNEMVDLHAGDDEGVVVFAPSQGLTGSVQVTLAWLDFIAMVHFRGFRVRTTNGHEPSK